MHAYNPRKTTWQQLDATLAGEARREFLNTMIGELSLQTGESPKQHWLVVGPRGSGKSHLLTLLYHKVKLTPGLKKLWIPVLLPEEIRLESNLARFLERAVNEIIHELKENDLQTAEALGDKIARMKTLPVRERSDYVFSVLSWITETTGKYILCITENLQQFLGKKLSLIEQKKLRAFLQTSDAVTVLGSATMVFNALHDHSHPFYNFFYIHRLADLSFDEMKGLIESILTVNGWPDLIKRVAENEARIKTLTVCTGRNPRIAVLLADILGTDVPDEMLDLLDGILDQLTPYYASIFQDIPDYLQAVLHTLAAFEPAQSPTEITAHLEGQSTTIRNYLKQLKDGGYVRVVFSQGRSNYYCLNDYLYRLWFQMRDGGRREETRWLLELLLMLYSPATIHDEKEKVEGTDREGAVKAYLNHLKTRLGNDFTFDFQAFFQKDIQPLLATMTPGHYIENLYSQSESHLSRTQNCLMLVLLGRHEIVREHIPAILTETNMHDTAGKEALDLLFFAIKFMVWLDLCLGKIHEALSLTDLYAEYIASLPALKKKETEVRDFTLGLLKLQLAKSLDPDSTRKIFLQLTADPAVPFAEVLLKILTCISEPDSLQSQQLLSDRMIAEVVQRLSHAGKGDRL